MSVIADIEAALFAHWSLFARGPGGELHDRHGLLWYESPLRSLPYNGVLRTRLNGGADAAIGAVLRRFADRGAPVLWFVHPSASPSDLGARLAAHGLRPVEHITCMSLELADWTPPAAAPDGVAYEEVVDDRGLRVYTDLTQRYWDIPPADRPLLADLQRALGPGRVPGHRYLAIRDGGAIGKGYLSLAGPPGVAAIFGMNVRPEARGRGVAAGLTAALLRRAREAGCHRAVLHSTPGAVELYRRAGFVECCPLELWASIPLWARDH
jgi:GNAT superfamily N-acetyltransferase